MVKNTFSTIINENYKEVCKQNSGAQFVKIDLHVHTPASGDAQWKTRYNFEFDIENTFASLEKAKKIAEKIVKHCIKDNIKLIAITDHNSPSNTHPEDLTNTWYELIKDAANGKDLCVLPGVEISTDDLHVLVIFDPKENEPTAYTTHRINFLLRDCKFSIEDFGNFKATGMSSLFDILHYIENLDVDCIVIPAHIDGGSKALLQTHKKPSNIFKKLLNHPNLNAVEVVKETTPDSKKIGKKTVKNYFASLRDIDRSPIAFIRDSDAHKIEDIGKKRHSYARLGKPDFWSLKNSLEDPETRIRMDKDYCPNESKTVILGMSIAKNKNLDHIAFNENLNCIIGRKRTNKSTIINLILFGLGRIKDEDEKWLQKEKYSVDVFIKKGSNILCYHRQAGANDISIYKKQKGSFVPYNKKPPMELPTKYDHPTLEGIFSKNTNLMEFLDRHIFKSKKMQSLIEKRSIYIKNIKDKGIKNSISEIKELTKVCDNLFKERFALAAPGAKKERKSCSFHLDESGKISDKGIFKVTFKKRKRTGNIKFKNLDDFIDSAEIKVTINSKEMPVNSLKIGEKNAYLMVYLMNQEIFGPLIIDEPEQFLDVSSIVNILVPMMRKLKTKQQIIYVTKDEHILFSGDAENVIVTQSEKKIQTISGDVNNKEIQNQVLEIFEGGRTALISKNRKLCRILE